MRRGEIIDTKIDTIGTRVDNIDTKVDTIGNPVQGVVGVPWFVFWM
jgi:hypothetical protein